MSDAFTQVMAICGIISAIGGAGAVIYKVVRPAFKIQDRVTKLESFSERDYQRIAGLNDMQKQQSKALAALLNHEIDGNGVENMKKIRDELLQAVIDN